MKAIHTKTLYATNTKPTRIKVQAEGVPHIIVGRDGIEGSEEEIHQQAALKLCAKYSWGTNLVSGGLPTPGQWVHCFGVSLEAYKNDLKAESDRADDLERQLNRALR